MGGWKTDGLDVEVEYFEATWQTTYVDRTLAESTLSSVVDVHLHSTVSKCIKKNTEYVVINRIHSYKWCLYDVAYTLQRQALH